MNLRAVFVDAAGTLMRPREPVGITYARCARALGIVADPAEVDHRFREALRSAQGTQVGDGRDFWRPIVAQAVGSDDPALFEATYLHYGQPRAWWVDLDALRTLGAIARTGVRLGIISNFDTRLRDLYARLALDRMFSVLVCSAEVEVEKPDPEIFEIACRAAGVAPREAIHIGDDPARDQAGASSAGLVGLHYDDDSGWSSIAEQVRTLRRGVGLYR